METSARDCCMKRANESRELILEAFIAKPFRFVGFSLAGTTRFESSLITINLDAHECPAVEKSSVREEAAPTIFQNRSQPLRVGDCGVGCAAQIGEEGLVGLVPCVAFDGRVVSDVHSGPAVVSLQAGPEEAPTCPALLQSSRFEKARHV